MYALATDPLLYYKILSESTSLKIRIWESTTPATDHDGDYLYIVTIPVTDLRSAQAVLARHLTLNGGVLACDQSEFPHKGQIRLLASSTWDNPAPP